MATLFERKAPKIVGDLVRDLDLRDFQAAGFVGNFGAETAGFKLMQEGKPVVPGSRGGYGWAQWTGPRRRQFEAWAKAKGLDVRSDAANYGFLVHELRTTEKAALAAVRKTDDVVEAAVCVETKFERPGVSARNKRISYAKLALKLYQQSRLPEPADEVPEVDVPMPEPRLPPDVEPVEPVERREKSMLRRFTEWSSAASGMSFLAYATDWRVIVAIGAVAIGGFLVWHFFIRKRK